jgi:asparagine synthase (glutamine-hydrolysing)
MCGIHLIISEKKQDLEKIHALVDKAWHRGKDGNGTLFGENYALGHNLLAINETLSQPIENEDFALVFNGEIYNYKELAIEYQLTDYQNDSDVLFQLLCLKKEEILPFLNGMFAFVFVEKKSNRFLIARDFFGQKPLFFYQQNELFIASSKQSDMLSVFGLKNDFSSTEINYFLSAKYTKKSIFEKVNSLANGSFIVIENQVFSTHSYKLNSKTYTLKITLKNAFDRHFSKNHRPAVLFSGGLDSSVVLYELHKRGLNPIAYTTQTAYSKNSTSDTLYAQNFCQNLGIEHHLIETQTTDFELFINQLDYPIGDGALFLQWVLCREIAKKHRVAYSGNGADELFGGYRRHRFLKVFFKFGIYNKSLINKVLSTKFNFSTIEQLDEIKDLKSLLLHEQDNYLSYDPLAVADQSGMAHQLEIRNPFLDAEIHSYFIENQCFDSKKMLKKEYQNTPFFSPIINRKKEGYGIPFIDFWGDEEQNKLLNEVQILKPFLSIKNFLKIEKSIKKCNNSYSNEYWMLKILCAWMKKTISE